MTSPQRGSEQGSALVMAIFVLALLGTMGVALLSLSNTEQLSSRASVKSKKLFFLSEAGIEDGRRTLWAANNASADTRSLTDELTALSGDGVLDFDSDNLQPIFTSGVLTGFTGINDDTPVRGITKLGDGWYAAFVTNDAVDGVSNPVDTNDRVVITGVAFMADGGREVSQAIVHRRDAFTTLPATITILGPTPVFEGGKSSRKFYTGDNYGSHCPGGVSGSVPIVGVIGSSEKTAAEGGVDKPGNYRTGSSPTLTGLDTVDNLLADPGLDSLWTDCEQLVDLAQVIKYAADLIGDSSTPNSSLGTPGSPKVVFIDGDYEIRGSGSYAGLLWVTGRLTLSGAVNWQGVVWTVGEGDFHRFGAGNGDISGGLVIADVAGLDRVLFTNDDCSGEDGVTGTGDDGIAASSYLVDGAGTSTTGYCSDYFNSYFSLRPLRIVDFRQR